MSKYIKLKAQSLHEISFAVRGKKFLVINCNFNPYNFFDFADKILKIEGMKEFRRAEVYPDGTGYFIIEMKKFSYKAIVNELSGLFADYFFEKFN